MTIFENDGVAELTVAVSSPHGVFPIETSLVLVVSTLDGTATGLSLRSRLEFDLCMYIPKHLFDTQTGYCYLSLKLIHMPLEDDEMFRARLTLEPADQSNRVIVSPNVATLTIQDNDGKAIITEPILHIFREMHLFNLSLQRLQWVMLIQL